MQSAVIGVPPTLSEEPALQLPEEILRSELSAVDPALLARQLLAPEIPERLSRTLTSIVDMPEHAERLQQAAAHLLPADAPAPAPADAAEAARALLLRAAAAWGPACLDWELRAGGQAVGLAAAACWCQGLGQCAPAAPCPLLWLRHLPHSAWVLGPRHLAGDAARPRQTPAWLAAPCRTGHWPPRAAVATSCGALPPWLAAITARAEEWPRFRDGAAPLPPHLLPRAVRQRRAEAAAADDGDDRSNEAEPAVENVAGRDAADCTEAGSDDGDAPAVAADATVPEAGKPRGGLDMFLATLRLEARFAGTGSGRGASPPPPERKRPALRCGPCGVTCNSQQQLEAHLAGAKHALCVKSAPQGPAPRARPAPVAGMRPCEPCGAASNGEQQWLARLA